MHQRIDNLGTNTVVIVTLRKFVVENNSDNMIIYEPQSW